MSNTPPDSLHDIEGRADLEMLVDAFYGKVQKDPIIGFIFTDVAGVNWDAHLPKMYDFWETMLFKSGSYRGNPLRPHVNLSTLTEMGPEQFARWKELFFETVDEMFSGENAAFIKNIAEDMAQVMESKITGVPRSLTFAPDDPRPSQ